jgi:hypothetical protein
LLAALGGACNPGGCARRRLTELERLCDDRDREKKSDRYVGNRPPSLVDLRKLFESGDELGRGEIELLDKLPLDGVDGAEPVAVSTSCRATSGSGTRSPPFSRIATRENGRRRVGEAARTRAQRRREAQVAEPPATVGRSTRSANRPRNGLGERKAR